MDMQAFIEKVNNFDINDIDWNNMGSWPIIGRVIFAFIVFVALLAVGYFLNVQALSEKYDNVVMQEQTLKKELETKAYRVANLDGYRQQLKEIEESFGSLLRQLPKDTEVAGLLEDITASALGANLDIRSIKLADEVETEFYTELPINIDVEGQYHDFGAFVSAVAGLGRIVTLHDFSVSSNKDNIKKLDLKIVAKTYRYNDEKKPTVSKNKNRKKGRK